LGNSNSQYELNTAATTIAEELAEQDRKRNNVVVYNLPKDSNQAADNDIFVKMCKEATDLVQKLFRIGKKSDNKARPLLICLRV